MRLPPLINELNQKLAGFPDQTLTLVLLALAGFAIWIALTGSAVEKAALAAWFIAP